MKSNFKAIKNELGKIFVLQWYTPFLSSVIPYLLE
jgi:hypothetical protein